MAYQPLKIRGLVYDTRLGIGTRGNFISIFRLMEDLHLNTLMLYIEDAYLSQKHSDFATSWALKRNDIRFLVREAKNHGIDVIPSFQSLGHAEGILKHKRYRNLAEVPGGSEVWGMTSSQFCPSRAKTLDFLKDIYEELSELFPSPYFNVCCDESFLLGTCPTCCKLVKKDGRSGLFIDYLIHLRKILNRLGKRTMVWGDMLLHHPEEIDRLPRDFIIVDWHYGSQKNYPTLEFFKKKGFDVIACTKLGGKGCYPDLEGQHIKNVTNLTHQAVKMKLLGVVHSAWLSTSNLLELVYYPLSLGARISYEGRVVPLKEFDCWFTKKFFGVENPKLADIIRGLSFSKLIRLKHRKVPKTDPLLWKEGWMHTWGDYSYPWQYLKKEDFLIYAYFNYQIESEKDPFNWLKRFPDMKIQRRIVKVAKRIDDKVSIIIEELSRIKDKIPDGHGILEVLESSCLKYRYFSRCIILMWKKDCTRDRKRQLEDETRKLKKNFEHLWRKRNLWCNGKVKFHQILTEREKILNKKTIE